MKDVALNSEQQRAVDARGLVFVSAGAGTGKTKVLVERFARAVCDEGVDVESILVITYTEKAAGELRARIRARLGERGRPDLARALDGAWISTIHGFCHRLLRSHPFAAGVDPHFRVLADDQGSGDAQRETACRGLLYLEQDAGADRLFDLGDLRLRGERAASYEEARKRVEQAALAELAAADRDLLQELLTGFAAAYQEGKDRESALDFEDLQLRARDLLRDDESIREREQLRFRSIMVDEFQDTNR